MAADRVVRVANGQGFWGDSIDAPVRLLEEGRREFEHTRILAVHGTKQVASAAFRALDGPEHVMFVDLVRTGGGG